MHRYITTLAITASLIFSSHTLSAESLKRVWSEQGNLKIKTVYDSKGQILKQQAWYKDSGRPAVLPDKKELFEQVELLKRQNEMLRSRLEMLSERLDNMEQGITIQQAKSIMDVEEKVDRVQRKVEKVEAKESRWKLSGEAYMKYEYKLEDKDDDFNEFDFDLMYVNFIFKTGDDSYFRYTPQLGLGGLRDAANGYLDVHTKYAFWHVGKVFSDNTWARGGMIHNPLFYHLWKLSGDGLASGYRYQMATFAENNMGLSTADIGLALGGNFDNKMGDWYAMYSNGEGYTKTETGKSKDAHLRLHFTPRVGRNDERNLHITLYGMMGEYEKSQVASGYNDKSRFFAQLAWKEPKRWMLAGEWLTTEDPADMRSAKYPSLAARSGMKSQGEGYSVFSTLNFSLFSRAEAASKWELLVRADHFDPDDKIANNEGDLLTYGVSYRWNKHYQTLISWHGDDYDSGAGKTDDSRLLISTHVSY